AHHVGFETSPRPALRPLFLFPLFAPLVVPEHHVAHGQRNIPLTALSGPLPHDSLGRPARVESDTVANFVLLPVARVDKERIEVVAKLPLLVRRQAAV